METNTTKADRELHCASRAGRTPVRTVHYWWLACIALTAWVLDGVPRNSESEVQHWAVGLHSCKAEGCCEPLRDEDANAFLDILNFGRLMHPFGLQRQSPLGAIDFVFGCAMTEVFCADGRIAGVHASHVQA